MSHLAIYWNGNYDPSVADFSWMKGPSRQLHILALAFPAFDIRGLRIWHVLALGSGIVPMVWSGMDWKIPLAKILGVGIRDWECDVALKGLNLVH